MSKHDPALVKECWEAYIEHTGKKGIEAVLHRLTERAKKLGYDPKHKPCFECQRMCEILGIMED